MAPRVQDLVPFLGTWKMVSFKLNAGTNKETLKIAYLSQPEYYPRVHLSIYYKILQMNFQGHKLRRVEVLILRPNWINYIMNILIMDKLYYCFFVYFWNLQLNKKFKFSNFQYLPAKELCYIFILKCSQIVI